MMKKLIAVAMLIATLGIGSAAYAQATGGSTDRHIKTGSGNRRRERRHYRRHGRHRRGGNQNKGRRIPGI